MNYHMCQSKEKRLSEENHFHIGGYEDSVTGIFLLKNPATPPRAVALRLSNLTLPYAQK
jgi:hypothetical protein